MLKVLTDLVLGLGFALGGGHVPLVRRFHGGNGVVPAKPPVEVHISTAFGAERAVFGHHRLVTVGAFGFRCGHRLGHHRDVDMVAAGAVDRLEFDVDAEAGAQLRHQA